jgi:quinolinate synthase
MAKGQVMIRKLQLSFRKSIKKKMKEMNRQKAEISFNHLRPGSERLSMMRHNYSEQMIQQLQQQDGDSNVIFNFGATGNLSKKPSTL